MTYKMFISIHFFLLFPLVIFCDKLKTINLSSDHLPYYFYSYRNVLYDYCDENPYYELCSNKANLKSCWGYELNCDPNNSFQRLICPDHHNGWVQSKKEQLSTFYKQGDFGYVRDQRNEIMPMCEPSQEDDSSLECSNHLRFCRGRNIFINFTRLLSYNEPIRYKMDVLSDGDIGGFCNLIKTRLQRECDHLSPLQSWGPELQHFVPLSKRLSLHNCDIFIEKPTFLMKIDATVNMYHHFCDFFNLYASLHINSSHEDFFSDDVHVLIWETYTYHSAFSTTFEAFTKYPIWDLKTFRGKRVCFKNLVFPLLPRMIFGLYYNTPLISGCERSGLFKAFSEHILYRLKIPFYPRTNSRIKITFLSRDTMYRRVLNERQLIRALDDYPNFEVNRVIFDRNVPFKSQLEIVRNSDILIGIHGAGLTHLLFLPDWAVVFELYNCDDPNCYYDLSRLRGIKYLTWMDNSKLYPQDHDQSIDSKAHAKFTNYKFEVEEFLKLVKIGAAYVKNHDLFPGRKLKIRDEL